ITAMFATCVAALFVPQRCLKAKLLWLSEVARVITRHLLVTLGQASRMQQLLVTYLLRLPLRQWRASADRRTRVAVFCWDSAITPETFLISVLPPNVCVPKVLMSASYP